MRRLQLLLWVVLFGTLSAVPANKEDRVPASLAAGYEAIRAGDLRADLTFLSSDALQGRLSLTRGSEVAIQWIASEFGKAGLQPLGTGNSYLQPVPLWEFRPDRQNSWVGIKLSNGTEERARFPEAYASFPKNVDLTAGVVFCGYSITAPELGYDDYQGVDAKGKIVLAFDHEPQENDPHSIFNGTGSTRYATTRVKALNAQAHGAVALLIVAEPNRKHVSNQERLAKIAGQQQRMARIPSQAIVNDELEIPSVVIADRLAAMLIAPVGKPGDLQSAIDGSLKPAPREIPGANVTLHLTNTEVHEGQSYNVAGLLEGSDPKLAAETIIISGHYDHDGSDGAQVWHGADDNGSGTVGVVELAHAFAANGRRPKRSLELIVFAAEERGLLGSYYYVQHPLRPLETTRAVINFDMIGRDEKPSAQTNGVIEIAPDTSNELNLIGTVHSPEYRQAVEQANKQVGLHLNYKWDHESSLNIFFRSDQFPFVLKGIPAMWWFTGFHPDYHQTTDTADKINYYKMQKIVRLAYLTAVTFGDEAQPPRFHERVS
jgi:hypothetical protein